MHLSMSLALAALASLSLAAPARESRRETSEYNCLADVIIARGIEMKELEVRLPFERRASWSYEGETGVSHWGDFGTTCLTGKYQSPINFEGEELATEKKPNLEWSNYANKFEFLNNGHTVQLQLKQSSPSLLTHEIDGIDYTVQQVHFHSPSEHHVEEKYFPLEAHFVHASADSKLNVIGLFFEIGPQDNPWISQFIDNIPTKTNATTTVASLDMTSIIASIADSHFFSYTGSLTTPPCTEGVLWLVAKEPLKISQAQLDKFTKVMPFNSRTTQSNGTGKNLTTLAASVAPVAAATKTGVIVSSAHSIFASSVVALAAMFLL
ncbi:carbonic anhydrase [Rhizoclosmatium globosum]|uniref:Carbonic anhydrase n=1 Tax=Rhizoclosmatium globosum TaxID=329046 RepID=A0A1Y2C565_9FUNG|nr:carbonic anhydrase [Rhizoclosmatium globosum]|eukprot:ORY42182.1 carbonic anhydrase [Rhizoclosmatium globosum]